MLEEALLSEIPTLILDPKGDMGNIPLNFPKSNLDYKAMSNAGTWSRIWKTP